MRFLGDRRPPTDLTYADVFMVPNSSTVGSRLEVDLTTPDGVGTTIPVVATVMVGLALAVGTLVSTTAIAVEEFTYHRYGRGRDLLALLAAAVVENIGYRQVHAWFRLRGLLAAVTRRRAVWTAMPRTGFTTAAST